MENAAGDLCGVAGTRCGTLRIPGAPAGRSIQREPALHVLFHLALAPDGEWLQRVHPGIVRSAARRCGDVSGRGGAAVSAWRRCDTPRGALPAVGITCVSLNHDAA